MKNETPKKGVATDFVVPEAFLHSIWRFKLFKLEALCSSSGEKIQMLHGGTQNLSAGPDFFNAKIKIGNQLWVGNVEMHVKSSDWYAHKHERDPNYDNVILHVVWEYDVPIFRKNNEEISTLILQNFVLSETLENFKELFRKKQRWILCEKDISSISSLYMRAWLTRLYTERLERKTEEIAVLLSATKNNWEAVLFVLLAKNFGTVLNGGAFLNMARSFDFSVLRKLQKKESGIETLLMGQAGFFEKNVEDAHFIACRNEYRYLQKKFCLQPVFNKQFQFFRTRPSNFPTLRISQLAELYQGHPHLFSEVLQRASLEEFYDLLQTSASEYWDTHYVFGSPSKKRRKKISKSFVDLLVVNTVVPLKFAYGFFQKSSSFEGLEILIQSVKPESNSIIEHFKNLGVEVLSALESQSLLELKNHYCDSKKCLECSIGIKILKETSENIVV
jgi:hypothetical protein